MQQIFIFYYRFRLFISDNYLSFIVELKFYLSSLCWMFSCSCCFEKNIKREQKKKFCVSQFSELHNKWSEKERIINREKHSILAKSRWFSCSFLSIFFIFYTILIFISKYFVAKMLHNASLRFTCASCVWQIVHYSRYFWSRFNALKNVHVHNILLWWTREKFLWNFLVMRKMLKFSLLNS